MLLTIDFSFWLLGSFHLPLHTCPKNVFGNDLGSASTCCAMDVECKGSELEPWGKSSLILMKSLSQSPKKMTIRVCLVSSYLCNGFLQGKHFERCPFPRAPLNLSFSSLQTPPCKTGPGSRYTFMLQEHKVLVIHVSCQRCDSCTYFCSDCSLTFNTICLFSD